jgi:hypothetical protein
LALALDVPTRRLGPGTDAEFPEDLRDVKLGAVHADAEAARYLLVREAFADEP